jgi:hypothetical protein
MKKKRDLMKKLALTIISFFLLTNVLFADTTEDLLIDEIVSQVDTEELRLIIEQLSGEMPLDDGYSILTRAIGTDGKEKAADFIAEQYSDIENLTVNKEKFNPQVIPFFLNLLIRPLLPMLPPKVQETIELFLNDYSLTAKYIDRRWENIIAVLKGEDKQRVLTTAHYDSIVRMSDTGEFMEDSLAPGADDNATGVAATIIAARILSQYRFRNSVYFMNVDAEEIGLVGSLSYALQHLFGLGKIKSVINVDMIGYDHDNDNLMNVAYGEGSLKDTIVNEYSRILPEIEPIFLNIDDLTNQYEHPPLASDHLPFYMFGVKNVVQIGEASWVTETEYDPDEINFSYHTEDDTVENINFDYMTEIVKLYVATLAREAGIIGRR